MAEKTGGGVMGAEDDGDDSGYGDGGNDVNGGGDVDCGKVIINKILKLQKDVRKEVRYL